MVRAGGGGGGDCALTAPSIRSNFDSGNLTKLKVRRDAAGPAGEPTVEVSGVVAPDMAGTAHKTSIGTKRWFMFEVSGGRIIPVKIKF